MAVFIEVLCGAAFGEKKTEQKQRNPTGKRPSVHGQGTGPKALDFPD